MQYVMHMVDPEYDPVPRDAGGTRTSRYGPRSQSVPSGTAPDSVEKGGPNLSYQILTLKQRPQLMNQVDTLSLAAWPKFMLYGNAQHWRLLFSRFASFQVLVCLGEEVAAIGNTLPFRWDGTVEDLPEDIPAVMERGMRGSKQREDMNTLCALAAIVAPSHQGQGVSRLVLEAFRDLARGLGFANLLAPVRPTLKARYPLFSMQEYLDWQRDDGSPFDPWMRVHWRLGGRALRIAPSALVVEGAVTDWEAWSGVPMPATGDYVVEGALQPVHIDRESNLGRYEDPNIWVQHDLSGARAPQAARGKDSSR